MTQGTSSLIRLPFNRYVGIFFTKSFQIPPFCDAFEIFRKNYEANARFNFLIPSI